MTETDSVKQVNLREADLRSIDRRNQPPLVLFSDQSGEDLLSSPNGKDDGPGY